MKPAIPRTGHGTLYSRKIPIKPITVTDSVSCAPKDTGILLSDVSSNEISQSAKDEPGHTVLPISFELTNQSMHTPELSNSMLSLKKQCQTKSSKASVEGGMRETVQKWVVSESDVRLLSINGETKLLKRLEVQNIPRRTAEKTISSEPHIEKHLVSSSGGEAFAKAQALDEPHLEITSVRSTNEPPAKRPPDADATISGVSDPWDGHPSTSSQSQSVVKQSPSSDDKISAASHSSSERSPHEDHLYYLPEGKIRHEPNRANVSPSYTIAAAATPTELNKILSSLVFNPDDGASFESPEIALASDPRRAPNRVSGAPKGSRVDKGWSVESAKMDQADSGNSCLSSKILESHSRQVPTTSDNAVGSSPMVPGDPTDVSSVETAQTTYRPRHLFPAKLVDWSRRHQPPSTPEDESQVNPIGSNVNVKAFDRKVLVLEMKVKQLESKLAKAASHKAETNKQNVTLQRALTRARKTIAKQTEKILNRNEELAKFRTEIKSLRKELNQLKPKPPIVYMPGDKVGSATKWELGQCKPRSLPSGQIIADEVPSGGDPTSNEPKEGLNGSALTRLPKIERPAKRKHFPSLVSARKNPTSPPDAAKKSCSSSPSSTFNRTAIVNIVSTISDDGTVVYNLKPKKSLSLSEPIHVGLKSEVPSQTVGAKLKSVSPPKLPVPTQIHQNIFLTCKNEDGDLASFFLAGSETPSRGHTADDTKAVEVEFSLEGFTGN